jgi:lysophospholipase L1-like esterase
MTTSYITAPDAGAIGELEDDSAYPYSTTSWYFLDAADAAVAPDTHVVVALGDSITDGTASTLNGDDRWTDVLSRRLHAEDGQRVAVVDTGIGGNQVAGPAEYSPSKPFSGGPSATSRLDRDVLGLSGVTEVILFEGINDLGAASASPATVANADRDIVDRIRAKIKGVRVVGATVTTSRGSPNPGYGTVDTDNRRHQLNDIIRKPGLFDSIIDFDSVTVDPQTGELRPEFVPPSTAGGAGDKLHPNRAGYLAMGNAVDLRALVPAAPPRPRPRPKPPADDATAAFSPPANSGVTQ